MKILQLFIFFIIILIIQSCESTNFDNLIELNSDSLFAQKEYTINIQIDDDYKDIYGQLFYKSTNPPHYFYKVVKFKRIKNNYYEAKFKIDEHSYFLNIDISDGKKILNKFKSTRKYIFRNDGTHFKQSLYEILLGSDTSNYLEVFNFTQKLYPNDLGIFLIKWYFEGTNNMADKNTLMKDIEKINDLAQNNGDYYLALSVAYKLLKIEKEFLKYFSVAATMKCDMLNNDLICKISNDILSAGVQKSLDNNNNRDLIIKLVKNNINSFFTTKRLTSIITNDIVDINLINSILKIDDYHYYNLLIKKYQMLIGNYVDDSLNTIKQIEDEFEYAYQHLSITFLNNKNYNFSMIPYKQIFYELKRIRFIKQNDFSGAIQTILDQNEVYDKSEVSLIASNYERISDIYLNNLFNLDSSLYYAIKSLELVDKNKKILKKIENIKDNFFYTNLDLKTWIDSIKIHMKKRNKGISTIKKEDVDNISNFVIMGSGSQINLNNPKMNSVLFFYSTTCGPCKIIFQQIKKNKEFISSKKINLVYISSEDKQVLNEFMKSINLKFDYVLNFQDLRDYFNVQSVPVLIYINKDGKILNYQNGVSEEWLLTEEFMKYF